MSETLHINYNQSNRRSTPVFQALLWRGHQGLEECDRFFKPPETVVSSTIEMAHFLGKEMD